MSDELTKLISTAPSFLQPKLVLFLSVDIVGSTAYKQTSHSNKPTDDPVEPWVTMVTHFYRDFSTNFITECQKFERLYKNNWIGEWKDPALPSLWKAAGDELIYCVHLTDHRFSVLFVSAWVEAIKAVRPILQTYSTKLNLKASSWLAGFPVNNTEVILGLGKSNGISLAGSHNTASDQNMLKLHRHYSEYSEALSTGEVVDFIGPSLDIGFRLGSLATTRRMICSIELAWQICKALEDKNVRSVRDLAENCKDNASVFHISERQILKGVLDGISYPVIWIDIGEHKEFNSVEDKVFANAPRLTEETAKYCQAFVESCNMDYLSLPFIVNDHHSEPKDSYIQKYKKLLSKWEKVLKDHEDATPNESQETTERLTTRDHAVIKILKKRLERKITKQTK